MSSVVCNKTSFLLSAHWGQSSCGNLNITPPDCSWLLMAGLRGWGYRRSPFTPWNDPGERSNGMGRWKTLSQRCWCHRWILNILVICSVLNITIFSPKVAKRESYLEISIVSLLLIWVLPRPRYHLLVWTCFSWMQIPMGPLVQSSLCPPRPFEHYFDLHFISLLKPLSVAVWGNASIFFSCITGTLFVCFPQHNN